MGRGQALKRKNPVLPGQDGVRSRRGGTLAQLAPRPQPSFLMSWRAEKSTWTEGPMVEVTYRERQ